jgi:hypothetical protein
VRKLEITQTFVELKDATENVLAAPPNASVRAYCKTFKRAIWQSMPQPKEGRGGRDIDVAIRGIIGPDGKVHQAVVQSAERDDLGIEALGIVQQSVFAPALCDGQPNITGRHHPLAFRRERCGIDNALMPGEGDRSTLPGGGH